MKSARYSRNNRAWLTVVASLVTAAALFFGAKPDPTRVYRIGQMASMQIEVPDGRGSGFVIQRVNARGETRLFLVTADHVMQPGHTEAKARICLRSDDFSKDGFIEWNARLVKRFEDIDVAVLWLDAGPQFFSKIDFSKSTAVPGTRIFSVGSAHKAEHDNAIADGLVAQVGFDFRNQVRAWKIIDQMTNQVNPGDSGGPVFNESTGKVIGVSVGTEFNGINFFVPVRAIRAYAEVLGVAWITDNQLCPPDDILERMVRDNLYE